MWKTIKDFFAFKSREKLQKSKTPYFQMNVLEMEEVGDIKVEMDWNPTFINQLKTAGYEGITDEQIIENYLHRIFERAYMKNFLDAGLMAAEDDE